MINFNDVSGENKTKDNLDEIYIPDHRYRILIIGYSGSRKRNASLDLINNQPDVDKINIYSHNPYEAKYKFLMNKV